MDKRSSSTLALAFLLGLVARELVATPARADEQAWQRPDVLNVVRALEAQTRAIEANGKATHDAGRELRDAVRDVGRSCGR